MCARVRRARVTQVQWYFALVVTGAYRLSLRSGTSTEMPASVLAGMDWTLSQTTGAVRGMGGAGGARGASAADAFEEVTSEETTSGA